MVDRARVLVLVSVPFGAMWLDYWTALVNAQNPRGLEYTLGEWPLMIAPLAAWLGEQTRGRAERAAVLEDRPDLPSAASTP